MRQRRKQLSPFERHLAGLRLARHATHIAILKRHDRIALYFDNDGEIPTRPLITHLIKLKKQVYLPVLHPLGHPSLLFYRYRPGLPMPTNRFGIPEPEQRGQRATRAWTLPLVFTPLVAFDKHGNRLGMGGGYYDRTFDRSRCRARHTALTGLAYQFQEVGSLDAEPWDTPLAAIVTDGGHRCFGTASGIIKED
ncbi:MAG: 5-formyltetrahydrofolate cyclo-ligase [Hahellaceae bacterium]|nr:5-formyltetrahydrofolate cyclo-ligase [Hahellaceae bacterium]